MRRTMWLSLLVIMIGLALALHLEAPWAQAGGMPESNQAMQQQWIGDVAQVAKEQSIPRGELIKQLVLDIIDEVGYVKALLWLAMLPLLTLLGTVFGVFKLFKRKS